MFLPSFIYMVPWVLVVQMTWLSPLTLGLLPKNLSWDSPSLTATQGTIYHIFEYTSMHTPIIEQPNTTVMRKTGKNLLHLFTSISFFFTKVECYISWDIFFAKINVHLFQNHLSLSGRILVSDFSRHLFQIIFYNQKCYFDIPINSFFNFVMRPKHLYLEALKNVTVDPN